VNDWDYKDFVWTYPKIELKDGARLSALYTEAHARLDFWQPAQQHIHLELQKWLDQGWQPIGEVGPSGIKLNVYTLEEKRPPDIGCLDVLAWVVSFGIWFVIALLNGELSTKTYYWNHCIPLEFRVNMRHEKQAN